MKLKRLLLTTAAFVTVSAIIGAVLYHRLPDPMPTHFAFHSQANGFTAKPIGVFLTPAFVALLGLFLVAVPRVSPKAYRFDPFLRVYEIVAITLLTVEFVDGMLGLYRALGHPLDVDRTGTIGIGVVLLVLGNYLGKVTRNFFVGIRTPWTLANPEVWLRTHRVGGVLCVLAGAIILIASFVGSGTPAVAIGVILVLAVVLTGYSYVLYRRLGAGDLPG
jgi:immunity protein, SdpI family